MSSHHIYPVPHLLLRKSTLYPSFLLSSFVFSPLRDLLLLCVCCCLESTSASVSVWMPHISTLLSSTPLTLWLALLFLLLLWLLLCLLTFLPGLLLLSLYIVLFLSLSICFILLSLPSSTLFYMFCRWIRGTFFLFALFHFLCRAVVRSAEVPSPPLRGPVRHVEAVDSCLRPPQHPGPMLLTPLWSVRPCPRHL